MKLSVVSGKHAVTFDYVHYQDIIEPGPDPYDWTITQPVKSWLSSNNVKVFTDFNCGDSGDSVPITTFFFVCEDDAREFYARWSKPNLTTPEKGL